MTGRIGSLLVVAVLLVGCGDDGGGDQSGPTSTSGPGVDRVIALEFEDGELVGGSRQEAVGLGEEVQMIVTGDVGDEIHVHGYDLYLRPTEGERELIFDALIPGTFEIELEGSGRLLLRMTVS